LLSPVFQDSEEWNANGPASAGDEARESAAAQKPARTADEMDEIDEIARENRIAVSF
jgi:hypothetical protein